MDTDALADEILGAPKVRDRELRRLIMDRMASGGAVKMGKGGLLKRAVKEALRLAAPQDEALRIAQKNAAKPVSEGGLGLRPDNTPIERAKAMGYGEPVYRGHQFGTGRNKNTFYSSSPDVASAYAVRAPGAKYEVLSAGDRYLFESLDEARAAQQGDVGGKVKKLKEAPTVQKDIVRSQKPLVIDANGANWQFIRNPFAEPEAFENLQKELNSVTKDKMLNGRLYTADQQRADILRGNYHKVYTNTNVLAEQAKKLGYDSITIKNLNDVPTSIAEDVNPVSDVTIALNPKNIRSRFAAFDPARIDENDLLVGVAALGITAPMLTSEEPEYRSGGAVMMKRGGRAYQGGGEVDPYNTSPDQSDGGLLIPDRELNDYAKGGDVKLKEGGMDYEQLKKLAPFYASYGPGPDEEEEQARRRLADLERRVVARDYAEPPKATMQEGLRGALQSGLGRVMPERQAGRYADLFSEAGSYVLPPMIGEEAGYALGRAYEAGKRGDYGEAALEGTMGALGVLPAAPAVTRMAERGANVAVPAMRRQFTPATITAEATAPDLGQLSSYGFRQGLNDRLLQQLASGRKAREGQGVFTSDITNKLETNPLLAIDVARAGKIGEGRGSNEALRREIAQAGIDLNQESMGAHRFIPLVTNNPEDASAMLIKSKGGLSNEEVIKLGERLGNDMVVAHNPRLGGVVIYPFGPVGKGGAPEFAVAKKTAEEILGKKGKIQYGVADYDKDRLYMKRSLGDYQRAGAQPMSAEQANLRQKLQGLEQFMFPQVGPRMFSSRVTETERSSPLQSVLQSAHRALPGKVR